MSHGNSDPAVQWLGAPVHDADREALAALVRFGLTAIAYHTRKVPEHWDRSKLAPETTVTCRHEVKHHDWYTLVFSLPWTVAITLADLQRLAALDPVHLRELVVSSNPGTGRLELMVTRDAAHTAARRVRAQRVVMLHTPAAAATAAPATTTVVGKPLVRPRDDVETEFVADDSWFKQVPSDVHADDRTVLARLLEYVLTVIVYNTKIVPPEWDTRNLVPKTTWTCRHVEDVEQRRHDWYELVFSIPWTVGITHAALAALHDLDRARIRDISVTANPLTHRLELLVVRDSWRMPAHRLHTEHAVVLREGSDHALPPEPPPPPAASDPPAAPGLWDRARNWLYSTQ